MVAVARVTTDASVGRCRGAGRFYGRRMNFSIAFDAYVIV